MISCILFISLLLFYCVCFGGKIVSLSADSHSGAEGSGIVTIN